MADTIDSLSIELTADTSAAEGSIDRLILKLERLKSAVSGASNFSKVAQGIARIAAVASGIDNDASKKLANLAESVSALSKVGDLSNLNGAGKNLASVVKAVNGLGSGGAGGLGSMASAIRDTGDALGGIRESDVSKLGAIRDTLAGEVSGPLHTSGVANESAVLGGFAPAETDVGSTAVAINEIASSSNLLSGEFEDLMNKNGVLSGELETLLEDATEAAKAITDTGDSSKFANMTLEEMEKTIGSVTEQLQAMAGTAETAGNALQNALSDSRNVDSVRTPNLHDRMVALREEMLKTNSFLNGSREAKQQTEFISREQIDSFVQFADKADILQNKLEAVKQKLYELYNSKPPGQWDWEAISNATEKAQRLQAEIDKINIDDAANKLSALDAVAVGLKKSFGGLGSGIMSFHRYLGKQLLGNITKVTKGFTGLFSSVVRIAKYRAIRTALRLITQDINEGIKSLYHWSATADGQFKASMDKIATATRYIGNSFAAMVSPIINAVAPVIDFLADKIVDLFNIVNQVISGLLGSSTYTAAKKIATEWEDSSKTTKKAADSMKRTILGFDEINRLQSKSDSSSGGGGTKTDYSGMFEKRDITEPVSDFTKQLKQAIAGSKWKQLGKLLGGKVNELVESIDFAGAGRKVGEGINAWFTTKYWTLETIDFTNIGGKIAEFLNNAISNIDFNVLGRLLVQKMTIIGDLIIGFFTNFNRAQAASKIGDFIKGLYGQLTEWFQKYDWGDLGLTLYNKVVDVLTNFDFKGVVSSFFRLLGTAAKAVISLGAGFVAGLWNDVSDYWEKNIKAATFAETAKNVLKALGQGFVNIGQWVWDIIIQPFGAALTGNEKWDADLLEAGINIVTGIYNGIKNAIAGVGTWIKENIFDPFITWLKNVFGIASPAKTMEDPGEQIVYGIYQGIKNALKNIGKWIHDNIYKPFSDALLGPNGLQGIWQSLKQTAASSWSAIKTTILNAWDGISGKVTNVWNSISTTINDTWSSVSNFTSTTWTTLKTSLNDTWNNLKNWASEIFTSIRSTITTTWDKLKSLAVERWNAIKNTLTSTWNALKTTADKTWALMKEAVSSAWNTIRGTTTSVWSNIKSSLSTIWNNIKSNSKTAFTNIKTTVTNAWDSVKNALKKFGDWLGSTFSSTWEQSWRKIVNGFGTIFDGIKEKVKGPINAVIRFLNTLIGKVESAINKIVGGINSALTIKTPTITLPFGGGTWGGWTWSPDLKGVSWSRIEELAKGGILENPTLFGKLGDTGLVGGEAGREAVLPLESHTEWMDNVAKRTVAMAARSLNIDAMYSAAMSAANAAYSAPASVDFGGGYETAQSDSEAGWPVMPNNDRELALMQTMLEVLRNIEAKDTTVEVTAQSVTRAQQRMNRRAGVTIVPVG